MDYLSQSPSTIYASTPPTPSNVPHFESRTTPTAPTTPTPASTTPTATECARHFISDLASNASVRLLQPPPPAAPCNVTLLDEAGGSAEPFLFDRGDVRGVLITLYTVVFITGFVAMDVTQKTSGGVESKAGGDDQALPGDKQCAERQPVFLCSLLLTQKRLKGETLGPYAETLVCCTSAPFTRL
ncbi:uncharacterized protein LOC135108955 [Scylla paramamosain]|uniref:uncharacterized protein LOC135108955 n=1 Tax=Scylla paramamosain TaxID=85552 RepID=UPI003082D533